MTFSDTPTGGQEKATGKGFIGRDGKLGALASGAVTAALLYVGDWLAELDVTPLPDLLEPLALGAIAMATAWITTKRAKRA